MNSSTGSTGYKYNADFSELTFTFDPKAKWSDGQPLTSSDFKFTVELLRDRKDLLGGGGDLSEFVKDRRDAGRTYRGNQDARSRRRDCTTGSSAAIGPAYAVVPEHIWRGRTRPSSATTRRYTSGPYGSKEANPRARRCSSGSGTRTTGTRTSSTRPRSTSIFQSTAK